MLMSVPIDVQAVVGAVAGNDPTGEDLRLKGDADFAALRELVAEAQRRSRPESTAGAPDWASVVAKSAQLLAQKTKDIQVLGWFVESSARAHGMEGLACALEAAAGVVDQFLPQMHPREDDEFRLRPLIVLDNSGKGTLIELILRQPVISAASVNGHGPAEYTVRHRQSAELLSKLDPEKRDEKVRSGAVTSEQIAKAASQMTHEQASATARLIDRAIAATERLRDGLLRHCGADAPPTSAILESLQSCKSMLATFAKDKLMTPASSVDGGNGGVETGNPEGRPPTAVGAVPMNREAILNAISRLVAALDALEPQNLAVPAFHQAIAWARMDRVALLTDLLDNASGDSAREKLFRLLGLKAPEQHKSE
jgi:type VI secretion system protein ImpA